jgi:CRISPR-associated endonuclease Csn1
VDALAVALTTRAAVKRLSDFHARARLGKPPELPVPWPNLWQEAREWAERMVVSHRVQRKVSGPLHAENPWRLIGPDTEDPTSNRYGVRKPVEQVSAKELKDIPDKTVRGYVAAIQEAKGDQTAVPAPAFPAPRRTRLHLKRQPRAVVPLRPDGRVVADKSDNHHMAVYGREGRCETYRIVTMFEAVSRKAAGGPVVRPWIEAEDGARLPLLCSLARGDLLELAEAADTPRYAVVRGVWDNGQVELAEHRSAQRDIWSRPNVTSVFGRLGGKKVSVDPIGRVRKTRD